jgi:tRNA(fMet)-specific endonuclease VapC
LTGEIYLLDTNIAGYILNGKSSAARARFREAEDRVICGVSVITEAEARYGCARRPGATRLREEVENFFRAVQIFPWDSAAARSYAQLRAQLQVMGRGLAQMDMLIAAHAHALGAILVTRDAAFAQLSEVLPIENWATDI